MILKYIEAIVSNNVKHYDFTNRDIEFDKTKGSIILPKEYVEKDLKEHLNFIYSIFYDELISRKLYSSISNIKRAIKNDVLNASISITYCSDISKSDNMYYMFRTEPKSLNQVARYCTGIDYVYDLKTEKIKRYEVYGDLVLGDRIERDESYYTKFKLPKELYCLNDRLK